MIKTPSLVSLLQEEGKRHEIALEALYYEYEVATFIESLDYTKSENLSFHVYCYGWRVKINVQKLREDYVIDIPEIIENLAGPLHREYGIFWNLVPDGDRIVSLVSTHLRDSYRDIKIEIYLEDKDLETCKIEKRLVRVKTDEELEEDRYVYERLIECQ